MMNKRVLNSFLYGTLLFSLGTGVVSCKDYDSDIEGLNNHHNRGVRHGQIQRKD